MFTLIDSTGMKGVTAIVIESLTGISGALIGHRKSASRSIEPFDSRTRQPSDTVRFVIPHFHPLDSISNPSKLSFVSILIQIPYQYHLITASMQNITIHLVINREPVKIINSRYFP